MFGAFARLNYFLFPSLYTEWIYTGDFFRLAFYVAILGAAAREIGSYRERPRSTAVLEERRRMARDLHDGLAQELAFIGRNLRRLDDGRRRSRAARGRCRQRSLNESRRAIAALTEPRTSRSTSRSPRRRGRVAEREGTRLDARPRRRDVELDSRRAGGAAQDRCEASTNAARHGGARLRRVELVPGAAACASAWRRRERLRPGRRRARGEGFGLVSMRERAARARRRASRATPVPGSGTHVEVVL